MSSLGLLEAEIVSKRHGCYICGCGSGLVFVGGALVVGGGSVCGQC